MMKRPSQSFARHPKGNTIHFLRGITSTTTCLCKNGSASTAGIQDPDAEKKVLLREIAGK